MSSHKALATWVAILGLLATVACEWDGRREQPQPNRVPTVKITGGATEGADADWRVEFFWFGSDPDGTVDHFLYAIDDTCLCAYAETTWVSVDDSTTIPVVEEIKGETVEECMANGAELNYDHPDSVWKRLDAFSGSFNFTASTPAGGAGSMLASDWHTFYIKAVDNNGARSLVDQRFFNAVTIAPTVFILAPEGSGTELIANVSTFFTIRWFGRDEDSARPDKKPNGYQLRMVQIPDSFIACDATSGASPPYAITYLTNPFLLAQNILIPDSLLVPLEEELTDSTYWGIDWWPKVDDPYVEETIQMQNIPDGDYIFGVKAVDQAGAVMPDDALFCKDTENDGNCVKLIVDGNQPVNPHLTVSERNLLGSFQFSAPGQEWEVEVPVNVPLEFEWVADASWYGSNIGGVNYALDIADPGCEVCQADDGVGGWIGWGNHQRIPGELVFGEADAGEQHILYIRVRDESFSPERELLAVIVMDVIAFSFDRTAMWVDDFKIAGIDDCEHDAIVGPVVREAIAPHLAPGETLEEFAAHNPTGPTGCQESSAPVEIKLSLLSRFKMIYWNVAPAGLGSALGSVTTNPEFGGFSDTEKFLSIYVRAGGSLIVWGTQTIGTLLGDYYPGESWTPELPQFPNGNFGPGTFVWDVMKFKTQLDYVGRGVNRQLQSRCSGIIGYEATQRALDEGYPAGQPDPTGYDDSRTAIWFDAWQGMRSPGGGNLAVGMRGQPALLEAGLDTLYSFVTNSWSYDQIDPGDNYPSTATPDPDASCPTCVREACGTSFISPFEKRPVVTRYRDPLSSQGKVVWIGAPIYYFAANHHDDLKAMFARLTDWIFQ